IRRHSNPGHVCPWVPTLARRVHCLFSPAGVGCIVMKKWLLAFGLTLAAASPAYAFRCGSHLITEGDTRSKVAVYCGAPTEIDRRSAILRRPLVWIGGRPVAVGENLIEIPVEVWI